MFLLSRIKQFLSIDSRTLFYNAYILPYLDYCCVIWGNCSRFLEEKIVRVQKRAGRLILNKDFDTPSTFLFSWMTFTERVIYQKAIQMYKTFGTSPNYLKIPFTFTSDIHSRTLRSSHETKLYIPKPRIELFRNTFVFSGSSIWKNIFKVRYLKWYQSSG